MRFISLFVFAGLGSASFSSNSLKSFGSYLNLRRSGGTPTSEITGKQGKSSSSDSLKKHSGSDLSRLSMPRPIKSRDDDDVIRASPYSEGTWMNEGVPIDENLSGRSTPALFSGSDDVISVTRSRRQSPAEMRHLLKSPTSGESLKKRLLRPRSFATEDDIILEEPDLYNEDLRKESQLALELEGDDDIPPRLHSSASLKNLQMPRSVSFVDGKIVEDDHIAKSGSDLSNLQAPRSIRMLDDSEDDDSSLALSDVTWEDEDGDLEREDEKIIISAPRSNRATPVEMGRYTKSASSLDKLQDDSRSETSGLNYKSLSNLKMPKRIQMAGNQI